MDKYLEKHNFKEKRQAYQEACLLWQYLQKYNSNNLELLLAEQKIIESQKKLQIAEDSLISWMSRSIRNQHKNDPRIAWLEDIPILIKNQSIRQHLIRTAERYNPF